MDALEKIIADLNASEELQRVFGVPVCRALVQRADDEDLRIEEGGRVPLDPRQTALFPRVLDVAIRLEVIRSTRM